MNSFVPTRHGSVVDTIRKKADMSRFQDSNQQVIVSNLFDDEKRDKLLDVSLQRGKLSKRIELLKR